MSVYIKNMELPKDHPVCIVIDTAGQARHYDLNNDRYADDELFEVISIPPHGDLIDRDVLYKKFERNGWFDNADRDIAEDVLLDAPIIIHADESKEET